MLNMIAAPTDLTTESVCRHIVQCLRTNENDVTMAIMYQLEGQDEGRNVIRLRGNLGVPEGHLLLVDQLRTSDDPVPCRSIAWEGNVRSPA